MTGLSGAQITTNREAQLSESTLPPGWRPEWRPPKPARPGRKQDPNLHRSNVILLKPPGLEAVELPSVAVLRREGLAVLRAIALDHDAPAGARVGAAGRLADLPGPTQEEQDRLEQEDLDASIARCDAIRAQLVARREEQAG
jgi:hypothetical protein